MFDLCITVEKKDVNDRLDVWAVRETDGMSRSAIQRLIENKNILVNGNVAKPNYKIRENDFITVSIPPPVPVDILPEDIPLDILYEDDGMLVINKPRGMVVHPAPGHYSGTLVNALMYRLKDELSSINGALRPGIVHRLDKDTSGVIAVAKNDFYHQALSAQLQTREMSRIYKALLYGAVKDSEGIIDTDIARHKTDRKKMAVVPSQTGRRAITHYRIIDYYMKKSLRLSLAEARLKTGRTHQIRVHMAYIGHPVVGDTVYGSEKQPLKVSDGQILHAETIGFINPQSNKYTEVSAPMPEYFTELLASLRI